MFGKKKKSENVVVVTTKEELKTAIKSKEPCIEVQGNLARKMKWMTKLNRAAIIALIPALVAIGGVSAGFFSASKFCNTSRCSGNGYYCGRHFTLHSFYKYNHCYFERL